MPVIGILLAFFLGFRGENVGADTARYIAYFKYVEKDIGHMEIGWNYSSILLKSLGFSPSLFNFVVALVTILPICFVSSTFKNSKINGWVVFFLYSLGFYLLMFNAMRQFLAISIVFIGIYFLSKKKLLWYCACIFIASLFHSISILAIVLLFLPYIHLSIKKTVLIFSISFILGIFFSSTLMEMYSGKYYHDIEDFGYRDSLMYAMSVCLITNLLFVWLIRAFPNTNNNIWMKVFFVSIVVMNLLSNVVIGPRVVYLFSISQIIALALIECQTKDKKIQLIIYLYSFITFARYFIPELYRKEESIIPYYMDISF